MQVPGLPANIKSLNPSTMSSFSPISQSYLNAISNGSISKNQRKNFISMRTSSRPSPSSSSATTSTISSPSNPFIKHCVKLRQSSSYRHLHGSVLVVGLTPIREISKFQKLQEQKEKILDCLLLLDGVAVPEELYDSFARIVHASSIVMKKLSGMQSVDSIEAIALMRIPSSFNKIDDDQELADCDSWFISPHRLLILDGIQDPGNLGTLLRSAMAFRWDGIFLLPGCCDPFNEKAVRAARGVSFQLPIVSAKWVHLQALQNKFQMKMLAAHPQDDDIEQDRPPSSLLSRNFVDSLADDNLCLVLGSEGNGLSEKSKQACELVSIPMAGNFESLNVSVAGGIFLFTLQPLVSLS